MCILKPTMELRIIVLSGQEMMEENDQMLMIGKKHPAYAKPAMIQQKFIDDKGVIIWRNLVIKQETDL